MCRSGGAEKVRGRWAVFLVVVLGGGIAFAGDRSSGVPRPVDPPSNPATPEKIALGRKLFSDTRLSQDGTVACSTCHVPRLGFTDGLAVARGVHGRLGPRNSPTILNAALLTNLFHDGRSPSLEEQARQPFLNELEYGWTEEKQVVAAVEKAGDYGPLFEKAFGTPRVTLQRMARALATFQRTLLAGDSPFDRWWRGDEAAASPSQIRGHRLFIDRAGCSQCHTVRQSYALFTDDDFHNTGAGKGPGKDDPGRTAVTGEPDDRGKFRTPTLRNVELTAPYMHDGSLATLEEVVEFYVEGGVDNAHLSHLMRPLELTDRDREDLVAFLRALTSTQIPKLEECEKLLAQGRPEEAFRLFLAAADKRGDDDAAVIGMARAAVAANNADVLATAETYLRNRLRFVSPRRDTNVDRVEPSRSLLYHLGRVCLTLAPWEDAMGLARQEDARIALQRLRESHAAHEDGVILEANLLEVMDRVPAALAAIEDFRSRHPARSRVSELQAGILYRRAWRVVETSGLDDRSREDFTAAATQFDRLLTDGAEIDDTSALYRAYARHRLGETEAAVLAYRHAVERLAVAEKSLQGLRNVLARDASKYRKILDELAVDLPTSSAVLLFRGYELLQQDRLDEAEQAFRTRIDVEPFPTPGPHRHLAQVHRRRGNRGDALDHYAVALALGPKVRGLTEEYEAYVRERELDGFPAVDALVTEYQQFTDAGPDRLRFQIVTRNNLAFLLRDVAASFASRGPARIHTFPKGAPPDALRIAKRSLAYYEEAVALIPENAPDLPFDDRWIYAGVLNDTGLMYHYFESLRDLDRAEHLYLRSFRLCKGAYQDTYFYNLQFLYGFELHGRDKHWLEIAEIAKDAILKEDPDSPTGYSPDTFKRTAARRDFERLSATLR